LIIAAVQERTEQQFSHLLSAAGFHLERTIDLGANEAILEATPRAGWAPQHAP
jgi:hypothetical protein